MLTSAFGASIAASMATAYGCAGISSGRIRTGVWQLRTKSRVTVKTKSGLVRYILVRNFSTIAMVISGRRLLSGRLQPASGEDQHRHAGAALLIVDANRTIFVERHDSSPLRQSAEQTRAALEH